MEEAFITTFWEVATSMTTLIVPIICIYILFQLIHDLLWK